MAELDLVVVVVVVVIVVVVRFQPKLPVRVYWDLAVVAAADDLFVVDDQDLAGGSDDVHAPYSPDYKL